METDSYKTIKGISEGVYTEKRSRFLSFAIPVKTVDEAKDIVKVYRKKYYDARHVCWAYMIGADRLTYRANDDGEPSSTAGKPILGQINSNELTNILVIVIRYFGGIELGTSGLTAAYKSAARDAIDRAEIIEQTIDEVFQLTFDYQNINNVMRIIKEEQANIISQKSGMPCQITIQIRKSHLKNLSEKFERIS